MKKMLLIFIVSILVFSQSWAASFEVTQVIEVGSASNLSYLGALKWSPDGAKLAFYSQGSIYISDTLGTITDSIAIDFFPQKFEWWSNTELILKHKVKISSIKRNFYLKSLNIQTGEITILEQFLDVPGTVDETFVGPYKSTEGDTYYEKIDNNSKSIEYMPSVKNKTGGLATSQENIIYKIIDDKLFNISNDFSDTLQLTEMEIKKRGRSHIKFSTDKIHVLSNDYLYNLGNSTSINLGQLAKSELNLPDTYCSVCLNSFINPVYDELVLELCCEIVESGNVQEENIYITLYNFDSNTFINLTADLNLENCSSPAYSPDGLKIAILSNRKAFIIRRELVQ